MCYYYIIPFPCCDALYYITELYLPLESPATERVVPDHDPYNFLRTHYTSSFAKPKRWLQHLAQLIKSGLGKNIVSRVFPSLKNSPPSTSRFRSPSMQCTTFLKTYLNFKLTFSQGLLRNWLTRNSSLLLDNSGQLLVKQLLLPVRQFPHLLR